MKYNDAFLVGCWVVVALAVALAITWDMRRLATNRAGLPLSGWVVLAAVLGALVLPFYVRQRAKVRRRLIAAAWVMVGGGDVESSIRLRRLEALHRAGLIGEPIFRTCLKRLDRDQGVSSFANVEQ